MKEKNWNKIALIITSVMLMIMTLFFTLSMTVWNNDGDNGGDCPEVVIPITPTKPVRPPHGIMPTLPNLPTLPTLPPHGIMPTLPTLPTLPPTGIMPKLPNIGEIIENHSIVKIEAPGIIGIELINNEKNTYSIILKKTNHNKDYYSYSNMEVGEDYKERKLYEPNFYFATNQDNEDINYYKDANDDGKYDEDEFKTIDTSWSAPRG